MFRQVPWSITATPSLKWETRAGPAVDRIAVGTGHVAAKVRRPSVASKDPPHPIEGDKQRLFRVPVNFTG